MKMVKLLLVAGLLLILFRGVSAKIPISIPKDVDELLTRQADTYGLDNALVKAIAKVESNFDITAQNPTDPSYGLMQITPMLAQDYGYVKNYKAVTRKEIDTLFNPEINTEIACRQLQYLSAWGYEAMVQAYNVGLSGYLKGRRNWSYFNLVSKYHEQFKNKV